MAETFKVGANARELLRYTQRATRIVTDDISRSDARKIIQKVAALEDVRDIQKVCGTAVHALDTRDREGFSKSTFRLYGEGIRLTARQILLDDALTKSFIRDSHASQTGKGTDDGLMRLKTHMVDYYRREGHGADGWVLKGDVRHFFASIDHRKLKRKLKAVLDKRGVDPRVYELLCIYIDVMEDGLPLGYQTSQLFALMFLDEFDHIIKEKYRIKYYGRYMDDFYIICSDKKKLQCILRDVRALMDSYGLELNQKTAIFPLRNGIDFLGFHSYLTDTGAVIQKLRRDSSKRMKNKIRYWETAYPAGEVTKQEILRSFDAWDAHAAHGDTYSLRRKYADRLEKLLDCKIPIHRKINSNKLARDRRRARQCRCIYKKQHKALSLSVSQNTRPAEIMPWA